MKRQASTAEDKRKIGKGRNNCSEKLRLFLLTIERLLENNNQIKTMKSQPHKRGEEN